MPPSAWPQPFDLPARRSEPGRDGARLQHERARARREVKAWRGARKRRERHCVALAANERIGRSSGKECYSRAGAGKIARKRVASGGSCDIHGPGEQGPAGDADIDAETAQPSGIILGPAANGPKDAGNILGRTENKP